MKDREQKRIHITTLGCAKNEVDSSKMAQNLQSEGFVVVSSPQDADVIIVNTCSFIEAAVEESIDTILELLGDEYISAKGTPVIAAGCMPARYDSSLEAEMPDVAAFVSCHDEENIVRVVREVLARTDRSALSSEGEPERYDISKDNHDFSSSSHVESNAESPDSSEMGGIEYVPQEDVSACQTSGIASSSYPYGKFAYLKISDGCDRWCSYCTIPRIRGRYRSFTLDEICEQAQTLVERGARELVLIGQDTGVWGHDLSEDLHLSDLIQRLAELFPDTWIRIMYTQPEYITDSLLDVMKSHRNIANYLDIPFQHVQADIISSMNRRGSEAEYLSLIERIRTAIPDVTLRTTLMCGFPGESDSDFEQLCSFVENIEFDYVGVFAFSPEDGTKAATMPGQIDEEERTYRANTLQALADAVSAHRISNRIGTSYQVLIEGVEEDGQLFGRAICQAPEVDGLTYIDKGTVGDIVSATIEDTLMYDMEGSLYE